MQRDKWQFDISAKDLGAAAKAKVAHHEQRLQFWQTSQEQVMKDVREKGLDIEESLAGSNYSNKSAAYGPQVVVNDLYQRRLNESNGKIKEHTAQLAEYAGWLQVLEANASRTYSLNADDYLFFFGK